MRLTSILTPSREIEIMEFGKQLFEDYFSKRIDKETLIAKLGVNEENFHIMLCEEMEKNMCQQDPVMAEYLMYALVIWFWDENNIGKRPVNYFLKLLNELVVCDWHKQHEDIVDMLQRISDESSIEPLYQTMYLKLQYLEWDDNYSLQKRCTRAIAGIGGEKTLDYLVKMLYSIYVYNRHLHIRCRKHYQYF